MSKFNTIEISGLVSLHPKVETHKFLGFFEHVRYQPTRSSIESYRNYYGAREAEVFQQIADGNDPKATLEAAEEMQTSEGGDYRLDMCLSEDCQFAAFQVFERRKGEYVPYSKLCFLEGAQAEAFENLIA